MQVRGKMKDIIRAHHWQDIFQPAVSEIAIGSHVGVKLFYLDGQKMEVTWRVE
jgi:hypothetical protein